MEDTGIKLAQYSFMESYHRAMKSLATDGDFSQYGHMMYAINEFALYGERPDTNDFDRVETAIWTLIEPIIERTRLKATAGKTGGSNGKGVSRNVGNKAHSKQINNTSIAHQKEIKTDKDKDKDIKENIEKKDKLSFSVSSSPAFIKFNEWIEKECPHLQSMEQMTEKELNTLIKIYSKDAVIATLRSMENYKDTAKKNRNVYRTCRNWLNRDQKSKKQ